MAAMKKALVSKAGKPGKAASGGPHGHTGDMKLILKKDKKVAEVAAAKWRQDSKNLAVVAKEKREKAAERKRREMAITQNKIAAMQGNLQKEKRVQAATAKKAERLAKVNEKHARRVTKALGKKVTVKRMGAKKKALKRAAVASKKAKSLRKAAQQQEQKVSHEKDKAKVVVANKLSKALASRRKAKADAKKAQEKVNKAREGKKIVKVVKVAKSSALKKVAAGLPGKSSQDPGGKSKTNAATVAAAKAEKTQAQTALFAAKTKADAKAAHAKLAKANKVLKKSTKP